MSASNSKKYKSLTISEKKQLIEAVERGDKKTEVAKTFDIPLSTLSTILKDKNKIITASSSGGRKRNSKGEHPRLEECLVQWVRQCRGQNVPVSGLLLKEKAKSFAKELGIPFFSASDGWLTNFKKRNGIVFKKICGESSSVDDNVCSEWHRKLSTLLKNYEPRNVFNTDETALFFKCLPDKTFTFKEEKCHGGKHSKDRLTILLAVNMDGSEKLTPLLIGKAAKPRCFKGIRSFPITYRANKKAWMTTELFNEWLFSLNEDMKKQERKILLFLDNCTVHNNPPTLINIELQFFPPNTTSKLQPLDQGIIKNFKTFYRQEVVKNVLECIESEQTPNISVLTAMIFVDKAWKKVAPSTILKCFKKSGFTIEIQETENDQLNIESIQWNSLPTQENVSFTDYVNVDEDVAVWGVLSDADILENTLSIDEDNEDDTSPLPLVTLKEASSALEKLRNFSLQSEVNVEVFDALFTIENTIEKIKLNSMKQKTITDFFKK